MRSFINSLASAWNIDKSNKPVLEKLTKKYKLVLTNYRGNIKWWRYPEELFFREEMSCYGISRYKIHDKITSRSVKSIFFAYEVKNNIFPEWCIKTKGQIMKEFKLCLSNHKRPITNNMHNLPLVTCITYMWCYGFKKCLKIYLVPDLS